MLKSIFTNLLLFYKFIWNGVVLFAKPIWNGVISIIFWSIYFCFYPIEIKNLKSILDGRLLSALWTLIVGLIFLSIFLYYKKKTIYNLNNFFINNFFKKPSQILLSHGFYGWCAIMGLGISYIILDDKITLLEGILKLYIGWLIFLILALYTLLAEKIFETNTKME